MIAQQKQVFDLSARSREPPDFEAEVVAFRETYGRICMAAILGADLDDGTWDRARTAAFAVAARIGCTPIYLMRTAARGVEYDD